MKKFFLIIIVTAAILSSCAEKDCPVCQTTYPNKWVVGRLCENEIIATRRISSASFRADTEFRQWLVVPIPLNFPFDVSKAEYQVYDIEVAVPYYTFFFLHYKPIASNCGDFNDITLDKKFDAMFYLDSADYKFTGKMLLIAYH